MVLNWTCLGSTCTWDEWILKYRSVEEKGNGFACVRMGFVEAWRRGGGGSGIGISRWGSASDYVADACERSEGNKTTTTTTTLVPSLIHLSSTSPSLRFNESYPVVHCVSTSVRANSTRDRQHSTPILYLV